MAQTSRSSSPGKPFVMGKDVVEEKDTAAQNDRVEGNGEHILTDDKQPSDAVRKSAGLKLHFGGCSLTGRREENQDAFLVKYPVSPGELTISGSVACIADGVSCSDNGQKASHTAVMQFVSDYYATPDSWSVKHSATKVLKALNTWLYNQGKQQTQRHNGLATTFSAVIFKSNTAHIFHVGDSRVWLLRNNQMHQLSHDHRRTGAGNSSLLTRALGIDNNLQVDYQTQPLKEGDTFILTTDGVHDFVSSTQLAWSLPHNDSDIEKAATEICYQALQCESQDNATCLVIKIAALPDKSKDELYRQQLDYTVPPALAENNRIDGFRIAKVIYAGARSHIYEVVDEETRAKYVLKAPSKHFSDDPAYLGAFSNEYWVGKQINSHRIMTIYPKPVDSPFLYHVCEHIEGITLRQWMHDNPTPALEKVRQLAEEIVKAARVLQRLDMVHRDLKPENIMITPEGHVKLIDLGAVKVSSLEELSVPRTDDIPLGDANYIAPEYLRGEEATTASDLFSIAVIAFEMLTGQLPYKEVQSQSLNTARQRNWSYRSAIQYQDDLPSWLDIALKKACHPSTRQRYDVMSEFIADLYAPNPRLLKEAREQPLIKRNPVFFWKTLAIIFMFIAVVEWVVLYA